jgi:hypothetical protein
MSILICIILLILIIKLISEGFWTCLKWGAILTLVVIVLGAALQ